MDQGSGRLAAGRDGDGLVAPGVVRHVDAKARPGTPAVPIDMGERNDMLAQIYARVIISTGAQAEGVVRDVAGVFGAVHARGAELVRTGV